MLVIRGAYIRGGLYSGFYGISQNSQLSNSAVISPLQKAFATASQFYEI